MLIHDDTFSWEGWGGELRLQSGRCRLRIFDLRKGASKSLMHLKPMICVVSELPEKGQSLKKVSVRSCTSHIATRVCQEFNIAPSRMVWVEYYPGSTYGSKKEKEIPERFDIVEFTWHGDKAIHPRFKPLEPPLLDTVRELVHSTESR